MAPSTAPPPAVGQAPVRLAGFPAAGQFSSCSVRQRFARAFSARGERPSSIASPRKAMEIFRKQRSPSTKPVTFMALLIEVEQVLVPMVSLLVAAPVSYTHLRA